MRLLLCLAVLFTTRFALAEDVVKWSAAPLTTDVRAGEVVTLGLTAQIKSGWHIYDFKKTGDWVTSTAEISTGEALAAAGDLQQPAPQTKFDPGFKTDIAFFEGAVTAALPAKVAEGTKGSAEGKIKLTYQACDAKSCLPPTDLEVAVSVPVAAGAARPDHLQASTEAPAQPAGYVAPKANQPEQKNTPKAVGAQAEQIDAAKKQGLLPFLALSFLAGLAALLTPCVWPMVPVTVSYFSKRPGKSALSGALWYCLGIMGTFVALGLVTSAVFGAANVQVFAANPWVNLGLGALFVVLAANLFGVFEIVMPADMVNKAQSGTRAGGIVGPLLMGLVFSLTSFTCTVPFVGTLLVTASQGSIFFPLIGMLAFSSAFALPFFLLALFPSGLAKLPKSGTWLVDVKAYLGLLELAAALKFLSNFDVTVRSEPLGTLPKEVFLSLWAALFLIGALFLAGWIKFPHTETNKVGPFRYGLALANVGIVGFLLAGLSGQAQLGPLVGFLPPYSASGAKHTTSFHSDILSAIEEGKKDNKLLFVNFTGVTCTNCRVMEQTVFPDLKVNQELQHFARAELYTDRQNDQDRANAKLREELTQSVTNPVYVVMKPDKTVVGVLQGATDVDQFVAFLKESNAKGR